VGILPGLRRSLNYGMGLWTWVFGLGGRFQMSDIRCQPAKSPPALRRFSTG
jgi:hypothetical protein